MESVSTPRHSLEISPKIGQNWVPRFIERHPQIKSVLGRRIEASRMEGATEEAINAWFDAFQETVDKFKISDSNIYNMDETGFAIGSMESTRIIVDSATRTKWQANPGRQEWISVIECICADGTVIDPFVIMKGKNVTREATPAHLDRIWTFTSTANGWTSDYNSLEWLRKTFEPSTADRANGQTRQLICDGHGSHISGGFIVYCMEHRIELLVLPPHTSHLLQPLDVAIFGPLKKTLTKMLSPYHEAQLTRIQKIEWISSYEQARNMTFTAKNIGSAWRGAGLIPIDRKKALRYLSTAQATNSPTAETPPCTPTKQTFNNVFLTSSSPEFGALHRANEALEEHIMVLRTPVRAFVRECTSRSEQTSARHAIIRHENSALRGILNKRREIKKGKRAVLKGKIQNN